jgi:hypothetical protein
MPRNFDRINYLFGIARIVDLLPLLPREENAIDGITPSRAVIIDDNKIEITSINRQKPLTRDQRILKSIDDNSNKVNRVKNLLNRSGGRQFNINQTERIIFLTLSDNETESIDDLIKDLMG